MVEPTQKHTPESTDQVLVSRKEYDNLRNENLYLRHELEKLKRMIFGTKSERFVSTDSSQLSMELGQDGIIFKMYVTPSETQPIIHVNGVEAKKIQNVYIYCVHISRIK